MGENSKIEWTDNTFNPWEGCTKISPACANCYAEARNHRYGLDNWGKGKPRRRTSAANWKKPLKWNRLAGSAFESWNTFRDTLGTTDQKLIENGHIPFHRPRVFCASLADWLDDEVPIEWLADLLKLIHDTPNLDWLLLTKRPENFSKRVSTAWKFCDMEKRSDWLFRWHNGFTLPSNVWMGTTVENREMANKRIPELLKIPAKVRFLSCEPLLGELRIYDALRCDVPIHWVICGGESGPNARPMHPDWARSLRDQCVAAGVPFFFKQWGEWAVRSGLNCGTNFAQIDPGCTKWPHVIRLGEHGRNTHDLANCTEDMGEEIYMQKVGKKLAGRLLDGQEWNEFPKVNL